MDHFIFSFGAASIQYARVDQQAVYRVPIALQEFSQELFGSCLKSTLLGLGQFESVDLDGGRLDLRRAVDGSHGATSRLDVSFQHAPIGSSRNYAGADVILRRKMRMETTSSTPGPLRGSL